MQAYRSAFLAPHFATYVQAVIWMPRNSSRPARRHNFQGIPNNPAERTNWPCFAKLLSIAFNFSPSFPATFDTIRYIRQPCSIHFYCISVQASF
jgi:hypothetical protein